ncbi:MAG: SDR family oxidoreductase [bacterium]|nr:SDR family oxidoreductase [bacterium]
MDDLAGKVAVVTGAASGMGNASAVLLAERGATLALVDVNPSVEPFAVELDAVAHVGSVAHSSFCNQVIASVEAAQGAVDILVNAAGTIVRADGVDTSDEEWRRIFSVNVEGLFFMCRAALRGMVSRQRGSIINFGSIWGDVGGPGHAAYAATKGAVHQLTKSMALEHARQGVRINAVLPGEIRTPMLSSHRERPPTEDELHALADRVVPMGRLGDPKEVAEVVAFLASDASSYMTGSLVTVDAGYTAR